MLRPYLATFQARFQLMLQYRAAAVAGFFTQSWFGGVLIMVLAAFYNAGRGHDAPLSLAQSISYTWLSQAFLVIVPWGGDPQVTAAVREGRVGYDRLRPVDAYSYWFVGSAGHMISRILPRAAMIIVFAGLVLPLLGVGVWGLRAPASLTALGLFALSILLAALLSSAIVLLLNLVAVLTLDNRGLASLATAAGILLSGNLLPLPLYPDWARMALFLQPFAGLMDIPFRIYVGQLQGPWALAGLGVQVGWIVILVVAGRLSIGGVLRRLQIQGG